jgi:hypothetical protein
MSTPRYAFKLAPETLDLILSVFATSAFRALFADRDPRTREPTFLPITPARREEVSATFRQFDREFHTITRQRKCGIIGPSIQRFLDKFEYNSIIVRGVELLNPLFVYRNETSGRLPIADCVVLGVPGTQFDVRHLLTGVDEIFDVASYEIIKDQFQCRLTYDSVFNSFIVDNRLNLRELIFQPRRSES